MELGGTQIYEYLKKKYWNVIGVLRDSVGQFFGRHLEEAVMDQFKQTHIHLL